MSYIYGFYGSKKNYEEGVRLLKLSTESDYPKAWYNLGCAIAFKG